MPTQQPLKQIETVVRLFGDSSTNISTILSNLQLPPDQLPLIRSVLSILYQKIDRLRCERNQLRQSLNQKQQALLQNQRAATRLLLQNETLQSKLTSLVQSKQLSSQIQGQDDESCMVQISFNQTPPLKETYMSMQFQDNKQNVPGGLGVRSVSAFQSGSWGQVGALMRRYNLTPEEFKRVIELYVEEQQRTLEKLESEEQRRLYLQSRKSKNYELWMRRTRKEYDRGVKSSGKK